MKNFAQTLKSLVLALILVGGISYVFAWTGPTDQQKIVNGTPSGNVAAPINVGNSPQAKTGSLSVGTSTLPGGFSFVVDGPSTFLSVASKQFCLGTDCITAWPTGGGGLGAPQLDTGWLDYGNTTYDSKFENLTNHKRLAFSKFANGLGGNKDNYVVDLEVINPMTNPGYDAGIANMGYGSNGSPDVIWTNLENDSISLDAWNYPYNVNYKVRIRIWDTSKSSGGGSVAGNGSGGLYTKNWNDSCRYANPYTNDCSCPNGFTPSLVLDNATLCDSGNYATGPGIPSSLKGSGGTCGIKMYQCYK